MDWNQLVLNSIIIKKLCIIRDYLPKCTDSSVVFFLLIVPTHIANIMININNTVPLTVPATPGTMLSSMLSSISKIYNTLVSACIILVDDVSVPIVSVVDDVVVTSEEEHIKL